MAYLLDIFLNMVSRLTGKHFLILSDSPGRSLFDFERRSNEAKVCEYFGLGLHLIVTPDRSHRQSRQDSRAHADE